MNHSSPRQTIVAYVPFPNSSVPIFKPGEGWGPPLGGANLGFITLFGVWGGPTWFGSKQAASSTRNMGKENNSVVVLWIWLSFCRMVPMGVTNNHTKCEQETQWWRPETGVANGQPRLQKMPFRVRNNFFFLPQTTLKLVEITPMKGNGAHTARARACDSLTSPCQRSL